MSQGFLADSIPVPSILLIWYTFASFLANGLLPCWFSWVLTLFLFLLCFWFYFLCVFHSIFVTMMTLLPYCGYSFNCFGVRWYSYFNILYSCSLAFVIATGFHYVDLPSALHLYLNLYFCLAGSRSTIVLTTLSYSAFTYTIYLYYF